MGIPDHLTCLLRNLYAGQEATELDMEQQTGYKIGKGVCQGCILSPCLFNFYAEYIMWNAGLDESKAESRLLGEISTTSDMQMTLPLWQKAKKNKRASWWRWKEESEKADLKINIQKMKIMVSGPNTSWQIDGETMETVTNFIFLGSKIIVDGDCSQEEKWQM